MVNWKELGEVPDSEEEDGFDSQDSELAPNHVLVTTISQSRQNKEKALEADIWDVPDSQENEPPNPLPKPDLRQPTPILQPSALDGPGSSPLSSACSDFDLPVDDDAALLQSNTEASTPDPLHGPAQEYVEENEAPGRFASLSPSLPSTTVGKRDFGSTQNERHKEQPLPLPSQELGHNFEAQAARQAAVRYERSLRPRKPIQEHPYLLENAQYSTFLKQHGVRPLRMAMVAEKSQVQEASQDDDFEDDSQESMVPGISDESQINGMTDALDGFDSWAIPSSPPKTSPAIDRAGPSSQVSSTGDTDNTSIAEDELPALQDLLKRQSHLNSRSSAKRKASPPRSSVRKRKRYDVVDSDPLEPAARLRLGPGLFDSPAAQRNSRRSPGPSRSFLDETEPPIISRQPTPDDTRSPKPNTSVPRPPQVIDSDSDEPMPQHGEAPNENSDTEEGDSDSDSSSESGSELVQTVGRRIKGVLPASWLRLDQQASREKLQKETRKRQVEQPTVLEQRRGVAQPRLATPRPSTAPHLLFDDDSDPEDSIPTKRTTDEVFHNQTRLVLEEDTGAVPVFDEPSSDEGASVVEDNAFDHMLPSKKRQLKLKNSFREGHKLPRPSSTQLKASTSKGQRQPRIDSVFDGATTSASRKLVKKKYRQPALKKGKDKGKGHRPHKTRRLIKPPPLSILDVVEPDAPRFIKIAARAATRRRDQGRSSPGKKVIKLATREDHVDAMSVLNDWRAGSIRQRQSVSAARQARQKKPRPKERLEPRPLTERSVNHSAAQRQPPSSVPVLRKFVKHVSGGGTVSYQSSHASTRSPAKPTPRVVKPLGRSHSGLARPAQLETDEREQGNTHTFNARKRRLDNLYRKQRGDLSASSIFDISGNGTETWYSASPPPEDNPTPLRVLPEQKQDGAKSRFRKKIIPQRVDVEAPQYSRANDPIAAKFMPLPVSEPVQAEAQGKKLQGLGPYGTQYTHHFETFPLNSGVFCHESTLIGSGTLQTASSGEHYKKLLDHRPRISFVLGEQTLRWGPWDAQVSSELGVVLDTIAESLERTSVDGTLPDPQTALSAANFILKYCMDAVSLTDDTCVKFFVSRMLEVVKGFNGRVKPLLNRNDSCRQARLSSIARTNNHLLIGVLLILRLCQSNTSLMSEQFQIEDLLKELSETSISALLEIGLDEVRKTYDDLRNTRVRERGIRDEAPTVYSWVLVMKVLEHAQILRNSFWDITYRTMARPPAVSSLDASVLERLWKDVFTLLPLTEFNDKGIIVPGKRHDSTVDGWSLPQKLLKHVFQVYQENAQQSPSFNDYCRALVGRCHYLVQQWGWRKGVAIVGVIFDFFGSQNLAHLRNDVVYKSPKFLEQLNASPSLAVEPEDRCFHIFLKLVALSIKKLQEVGALNDIRNLVARTMPNHNRQLLKEQTIHERDLAALRNHHDLLCTLFWASPPDLRPGAHIIERLVIPASSHKEACIINMRAWNQLARFIIATGEATTGFKPFAQWRNTFFQQMMQQFDSVEQDMQQQFLALSKDASNSVSSAMRDALVKSNRAAVVDVLHFSVRASLDVMRQAPDLEAATFALNTLQLQHIFKQFSRSPPQLDWAVLQGSLATLETFLARVDEFKENEESQQSESQILNSAQADDAILVLDQDISKPFFSMVRRILASNGGSNLSGRASIEKANCTEQAVVLSARLGARFINGGLLRLSDMFKYGKYGLFDSTPANLSLDLRKWLVLFVNTLFKHGFDDFPDAGFTLSELWMLAIAKPRQFLAYENQLAEQLRKLGKDFVPDAVTGLAINPDYNTNRDLFEFAISWMRRSLRDAGPSLKKILLSEHAKTLNSVMQQIKRDLAAIVHDASEHPPYVAFIRSIITLIKTHGSEICMVDDFFYQINKEYSPSAEDPQLQVAGMMSYGLRLSEDDARVPHQLFFYLFNNFKMSLINNKMDEQVEMLLKGAENPGIRTFLLGKMLPAVIRASFSEWSAFSLVGVYAETIRRFLSQYVVPYELSESDLPHVNALLEAISCGLDFWSHSQDVLRPDQLYMLRQVISMLNGMWPSFLVLSLNRASSPAWRATHDHLEHMKSCISVAAAHINDLIEIQDFVVDPTRLLEGLQTHAFETIRDDLQVSSFTKNIINDVQKNWLITATKMTIQAPGKGLGVASTQSGQGMNRPVWDAREVVVDLCEVMQEWMRWWDKVFGEPLTSKEHHGSVVFF